MPERGQNSDAVDSPVVSRCGRNTPLSSGGCVDIIAPCEKGAGTASAVGQTTTLHGAVGPRVECASSSPRSRRLTFIGRELVPRLQDVLQWGRRRLRTRVGPVGCPPDQHPIPLTGRTHRDRRSPPVRMDRAPSTIPREPHRNTTEGRSYRPFDAHRLATTRRARHHRRGVDTSARLGLLVASLLDQRWSPQQISRYLHRKFPHDRLMRLCHESIYQLIYQAGSRFLRPSPLEPHRRSPLRSGRDHRRAHQRGHRRRPRFQHPMLSIHERPFPPEDRSQAGHWEGDLIVGNHHGSAIGTLVERQTRMVRLLHLPRSLPSHCAGNANAGSSAGPAAFDHLGSGHRNGPPRRHHPSSGNARLLLRFPITVATRLQRERQWFTAGLLSQRRQPRTPSTRAPTRSRRRTQQPAPHGSPRPLPSRPIRQFANLTGSVGVATLTRTRRTRDGPVFRNRRRCSVFGVRCSVLK